jgi:thiamine-phosphate pyrophosphorylase
MADPTSSPGVPLLAAVYPIINLEGAELAGDPWIVLRSSIEARIPAVQIRCKAMGSAAVCELAREARTQCVGTATRIVLNDRPDLARLAGISAVHLGQTDLPIRDARKILGYDAWIGVSTHSVAEALQAEMDGANYVGFGPMFPTATKSDAKTPRMLSALREVRGAIKIPIVAIGGITEATAPSILEAGATSVAMIGELAGANDLTGLLNRLVRLGGADRT